MNAIPRYRRKNFTNTRPIDPMDLEVLRTCTTFKTVDQHADFFVRLRKLPASHTKRIADQIQHLIKAGMFIEESVFLSELYKQVAPSADTPAKIEMIGMQTANRPSQLERMLESLIANLNTYDRTPEILISDDSTDANLAANTSTIQTISKKYGGVITHLDQKARRTEADDLAKTLSIDPQICRFALSPDGTDRNRCGAGRNTILLRGAGKKIIMLDDDVIIRTHTPPNPQDALTLTSSFQNGYTYFDSVDEAISYFPSIEVDYLGLHERWLGSRAADMFASFDSSKIIPEKLPGGMSDKLIEHTSRIATSDAKITFTHSGSVGDSWSRYHSNFDASPRQPHDLFGDSVEQFTRNMETPFVSRIDNSYTLYNGATCVSMNIGIDAREVLPPFTPLYRAQDNLFGFIGWQTMPSHFSARLPFAIEHIRAQSRKRDPDPFGHLSSVGVITRICLEMCSFEVTSDTSSNLRSMGQALIELSKIPREEMEIMISAEMSKRINGSCQFAAHMLAYYESIAPRWWVESMTELSKSANAHIKRITAKPLFADEPQINFSEWLESLGKLLQCWPDMYAHFLKSSKLK